MCFLLSADCVRAPRNIFREVLQVQLSNRAIVQGRIPRSLGQLVIFKEFIQLPRRNLQKEPKVIIGISIKLPQLYKCLYFGFYVCG